MRGGQGEGGGEGVAGVEGEDVGVLGRYGSGVIFHGVGGVMDGCEHCIAFGVQKGVDAGCLKDERMEIPRCSYGLHPL